MFDMFDMFCGLCSALENMETWYLEMCSVLTNRISR